MFFSKLRQTLVISFTANTILFCIVRPLLRGSTPASIGLSLLTIVFSAFSLVVYDKIITGNIWGKLKMSLANNELLQVVNYSNQGILIFCQDTNQLLLQNTTARSMFSPNLPNANNGLLFSHRDLTKASSQPV